MFATDETTLTISPEILLLNLAALKDAISSASKAGLWRKGRVDLFSIFERRNREALRSDVLAWLLDPDESHGCHDQLLRQFFVHFGAKEAETGRVSVAREHRLSATCRVDIFVTIGQICIAIENKIDAPEGPLQLKTMRMHSPSTAN
jgi:hypothetical protein